MSKCSVSLVDDHAMLRNGLAKIIDEMPNFCVISQSDNGKKFIAEVTLKNLLPQIVLLDVSMPVMDGFATAKWIKDNMPQTKILVLSMFDDEKSIIKMIRSGARGYILKDGEPKDLEKALHNISTVGYHYSDFLNGKIFHAILKEQEVEQNRLSALSANEIEFLKHVCSEMTYAEIATVMLLSIRTIEGYRDRLFERLNVRSRIGLAIYAIKHEIVKI